MPQGRRKTPFSGKAKKEQLQQKRSGRNHPSANPAVITEAELAQEASSKPTATVVAKGDEQCDKSSLLMDVTLSADASGKNKYDLIFQKESKMEMAERRNLARKPYTSVSDEEMEKSTETFFPDTCDYPKRPKWKTSMSKRELETNEAKIFREYVSEAMERHGNNMSYFELNLEVRVKLK